MKTSDFDYHLPEGLIAQRPRERGTSRLLVVRADGTNEHRSIAELPSLLAADDLVVVNDTRVIPARLTAKRRPGGGQSEIFLVEKIEGTTWNVLIRPARRSPPGSVLDISHSSPSRTTPVSARVQSRNHQTAGGFRIEFSEPIEPWLESIGHTPLPPYISRADDENDRQRYQTIFAACDGAVAAPTAGLHFDRQLIEQLHERQVGIAPITLHVGLGTFRPVTVESALDHRMDEERFVISRSTADRVTAAKRSKRRVVAIGTTSVRALESAALESSTPEGLAAGQGRTDLFITPGFRFRIADLILTNFHLPRSTLLMMISAFAGRRRVLEAYQEAIDHEYRFYSYGDAMLIERTENFTIV